MKVTHGHDICMAALIKGVWYTELTGRTNCDMVVRLCVVFVTGWINCVFTYDWLLLAHRSWKVQSLTVNRNK